MQLNHPKYHLGIFGTGGTGKTTLGLRYVCNAPSTCVFLFDPEGEFQQRLHLAPCLTGAAIDLAVPTGFVCFDPNHLFPGDMEAALVFFCDCAMKISDRLPGRKFFVTDELGSFISGSSIPKKFKHFVRTIRRYGVDCVWMAQGPNGIHTAVRDQLTEVICHKLDDACSLDFPLQRGFVEKEIRSLPLRQHEPGQPYYWIARDQLGQEARGN